MSIFANRLYDVIRSEISEADTVAIWNHYAEKNSYEHIYSMDDFNDVLDTTRSYDEVVRDLDNQFDPHAPYFYSDELTGKYSSLKNPYSLIDVDVLVAEIIKDGGYDGVCEVNDYFNGYIFKSDMSAAINELPLEDVKKSLLALGIEPEEIVEPLTETLPAVLYDCLEDIYYGDDYKDIYLMPEPIQKAFWGLKEADMNYIKENVGRVGSVDPKRSLEIAGFELVKNSVYKYFSGNRAYFLDIKINGNNISSVKKADRDQVDEAVR